MNTPHTRNPISQEKPVRVTVPVSPDVLEAFQQLAAVQGVSTGKAMGEWLADTLDGVGYMTDLLVKARQAPKLAAQELHAYAQGLTGLTADLIDELRAKSRSSRAGATEGAPLRGEAAGVRVRDVQAAAKKRSAVPLTPPVGNTGGKVPKTPKNSD